MNRVLTLALLGACASPTSRSSGAQLLPDPQTCRGVRQDSETNLVQCPDYSLWVHRSKAVDLQADLGAYLEKSLYSTRSTETHELAIEPFELTPDSTGRYYRVRAKAIPEWEEEGYVVVVRRSGGEVLHVVCEDRGELKSYEGAALEVSCRAAMSAVLAQGLPASIFATDETPASAAAGGTTFAGRKLIIPNGCANRYPATPHIDCGMRGKLSWTEQHRVPEPLAKMYRDAIDSVTRTFEQRGQVIGPTEILCSIDGVTSRCTEQVLALTEAESIFSYHALVEVRDVEMMVVCTWQHQEGDVWPPPPCDQVLEFPMPTPLHSLRDACNDGSGEACFELGMAYVEAKDLARQPLRAAGFLRQGCDGGVAAACTRLGFHFMSPVKRTTHEGVGIELLSKGCNGGDAEGCSLLGYACLEGVGLPPDLERGMSLLERACDGGFADSCARLGSLFAIGKKVKKDATRAVGYFQKACEKGNLSGCTNLALAYMLGDGIDQDAKRAVSLYRRACDKGDFAACGKLGSAHGYGQGVGKNLRRARELLARACEAGDRWSCSVRDKPDDYWINRAELERSCNIGSTQSCFDLGLRWGNGEGGPTDVNEARRWVKKACTKGHREACEFLPMMVD